MTLDSEDHDHIEVSDCRVPGDLLAHPLALAALVLVIINDRLLKHAVPGIITGKLSDFAGLAYFPLFLIAGAELLRWAVRMKPWELRTSAVTIASAITGLCFILIKTWDPASDLYRVGLGYVFWPAYSVIDLVQAHQPSPVRRFDVTQDVTDLIALIALVVPVWIAKHVMVPNNRPLHNH